MEGVSTSIYKGLRGYWRRRGYKKLSGSGQRKKKIQLGSTATDKRRRVWRIKVTAPPKLRFLRRITSPKKLFVWLRDAYVKLMLGFANSRMFTPAYGASISHDGGFGSKRSLKEYDEKMIVDIYRSLMLNHGQLVPRDTVKFSSEILRCRSDINQETKY